MRAAIYCRISRDHEGAGLGVERQREDCEALADRLGVTERALFTDNDLSAYSKVCRPGYGAMLAAVARGEIDVILAWHTDRLHRSTRELDDFVDVLKPRDVYVHTVKAGLLDLTTPAGKMTAKILGAVAEQESEHKLSASAGSTCRWPTTGSKSAVAGCTDGTSTALSRKRPRSSGRWSSGLARRSPAAASPRI